MALQFPPPYWKFSKWQKPVWNETRDLLSGPKKIWIVAGRGAGKDIVSIRCVIRDAIKLYHHKKANPSDLVLNPLVRVWVLGPSEKGLKQTRMDLESELRALAKFWGFPFESICYHNPRENYYELFGKDQIHFEYLLTSTNDSLRGPGVDLAIWTEFSSEKRPAAYLEEFPGTINRAGRLGRTYIYTTPKDPVGLLHKEVCRVIGGEENREKIINSFKYSADGREVYFHADFRQNEFLTQDQIAFAMAERANGIETFERERLALFRWKAVDEDAVYEKEWVDKCLVTKPLDKKPTDVLVGGDLSRLGKDETVFAIVCKKTSQLYRLEVYKKTSGTEIVSHIERIANEFGPGQTEFLLDMVGHQSFVKDWLPRYVRVTEIVANEREKERLVLNLVYLFQIGKLRIPHPDKFPFSSQLEKNAIKKLYQQLLNYQKVVNSRGKIKYGHGQNQHDDTVAALYQAVDPIVMALRDKADGGEVKAKLSNLF